MEHHSTTKNDRHVIGSRPGHVDPDQEIKCHANQPAPDDNEDVVGSPGQPPPGHSTSQDDFVVGSASQSRTQPIDRSHVHFVEPDTPLSTECLVQLIFDAYNSRNHASVKIITPLKPEESPKEWPFCLKTLSERPWTLCELGHRKIGDLEVVVATKEEHARLLSRDVSSDNSRERLVCLFRIYGQKPDFNQIEEEYGLKVLAWTVHGPSHGPFMDREGMTLPVSSFANGPWRD
ncbi:Ff.00g130110.m01.CDS01 [Fusarium sp. VM40]|nr:Ff.00g130110.m01.CDS01 [Fusarium sp. VM40]